MLRTELNQLNMVYAVDTFFEDFLEDLEVEAPALTDEVALMRDHLVLLEDELEVGTEDLTGVAEDSEILRNIMRDDALAISGGLVAYFTKIKNRKNAKAAKLTKSQIDKVAAAYAPVICKRLIKLTTPFDANVIRFGVTALKLGTLSTSIANFHASLGTGSEEYVQRKVGNENVSIELKIILAILYNIDSLMEIFRISHPSLYRNWQYVRAIYDRHGGTSTPVTVEDTIAPGEFKVVYTIAHNPDRVLMFENLHPDLSIPFGMSTAADSFSNPPRLLNAGRTSILLSSTLGPDGDKIVFHNTSAEPISIEITDLG